jgi:hypothetical protein
MPITVFVDFIETTTVESPTRPSTSKPSGSIYVPGITCSCKYDCIFWCVCGERSSEYRLQNPICLRPLHHLSTQIRLSHEAVKEREPSLIRQEVRHHEVYQYLCGCVPIDKVRLRVHPHLQDGRYHILTIPRWPHLSRILIRTCHGMNVAARYKARPSL